jgi:thioredoxin reductase
METLLSFVIGSAILLFFLRKYLKKLAPEFHAKSTISQTDTSTKLCPKCAYRMNTGAGFCPACGTPQVIYTIKSAKTVEGVSQENGQRKPHPIIDASLCIGCGACVEACPVQGVLKVIGGKAQVINLPACEGHGDCEKVCPVNGITLVTDDAVRIIEVPDINENFETNVPGVFIAGELGGLALIKHAINDGQLVMEYLYKQIKLADYPPAEDVYDVIIVGAGPAGLSAALSSKARGIKYLCLEAGEIASTIRQYPRHKFVMAEPLEIPLYGRLWVHDTSKEALLEIWETIVKNTDVRILTGHRALNVQRDNGLFRVNTDSTSYKAHYVVLAIGKRGNPRKLGVAGEELSKVIYQLIEAESYHHSHCLVVGGGDSAIESAVALARQPGNTVHLSYRKDSFANVKERNLLKINDLAASGAVTVLFNSGVEEITAERVHLRVAGEPLTLPNDYVVINIGGEPPTEFLQRVGVRMIHKQILFEQTSWQAA